MQCTFGHSWGWKWSSFGVALKNIAGNVDRKKIEAVKVQRKSAGSWWIVGRGGDKGNKIKTKEPLPMLGFIAKMAQKSGAQTPSSPPPAKQASSKLHKAQPTATTAQPSKAAIPPESLVTRVATTLRLVNPPPPPPPMTLTAQVPLWLLAASEAIIALTPEATSTMSVLAAVLITVGSIPALPGVAAGSTATALGTVAVGLGTLLRERAIASAD
ncbi:hypothetical protein DAEQUDRAFT_728650, partial [Daedalea quercina L-15889]